MARQRAGRGVLREGEALMPYKIQPIGKGRYKVVNAATGSVKASNTTKQKAQKQVRFLNMIEHRGRR
jgi:hypothetical protein